LKYLLDTNICIYLLNGNESLKKKVMEIGVSSILVTKNPNHFERIEGLKKENWMEMK